MKRRSTGDHAVTACDAVEPMAVGARGENPGSVTRRGHQPEPARMYEPHTLYKRIYAIRFELRCRANRRHDAIDLLTVLDRAITKLRREEIDLVEQLHRIAPERLADLDASTADWRTR